MGWCEGFEDFERRSGKLHVWEDYDMIWDTSWNGFGQWLTIYKQCCQTKLAITHHIIITYKLNPDRLVEHMNNVLHNILRKEMAVCENLHKWKKGISCNLGGEFHVRVIHGIHPVSTCTWVEIGVTFQSKVMITFCLSGWHQLRMEEF